MPARKQPEVTLETAMEEAKVVGDSLPLERETDLSGDTPPDEKVGTTRPTSRRQKAQQKAEKAAATGDVPRPEAPVVPLPQRASKLAVDTAGDFYALAGTVASVASFPMAGVTMQAQKDEAGKVLANWALANSPRLYSFLESAGKATAIVPLIICPVMAETYMRTENPLVETMAAGILEQYLAGSTIVMPDPTAPDGKQTIDVWQYLSAVRAQVSEQKRTMREMEDRTAPIQPMETFPESEENSEVPTEESKMAKILRGDGWQ